MVNSEKKQEATCTKIPPPPWQPFQVIKTLLSSLFTIHYSLFSHSTPSTPAPPCKKPVIARPVRTLAVAIRTPKAPLRKGSSHGNAVTEGSTTALLECVRRGRCPHRPAPPHYLCPTRRGRRPRRPASRTTCNAPVGADAPVRPPDTHRTPCKTTLSLRGRKAPVAIRTPKPPLRKGRWAKRRKGRRLPHFLSCKMPPAGHFLSPATESTQRTPPKPMVLESLRGRGAKSVGTFHPRELNGANPPRAFALSRRLSPATRSALVLPVQTGENLRLPCGRGRAPPLRISIVKPCVGAGFYPARPTAPPKNPLPPLPKGRETNRRLVEGFLRGKRLRISRKSVRGSA